MPLGRHLGIASGQLFLKDKIIIACGCIWAVAIKKACNIWKQRAMNELVNLVTLYNTGALICINSCLTHEELNHKLTITASATNKESI